MNLCILLAALNDEERNFVMELYIEHSKQLYSIALEILKNEQDASDALQETFAKIIEFIDKFIGDDRLKARNKIMIALRTVVYNTACRNYTKRKKIYTRETSMFFESEDEDEVMIDIEDKDARLEDIVFNAIDHSIIEKALLSLTQDQQDAVNLVYFCNFSGVEAAKYLEITDSALQNRLYHARKRLKEILKEEFDEYVKE